MKHVWLLAAATALSLCACTSEDKQAAPAEGRVNAVLASGKKSSFADLCDVAPEPGQRPFSWPPIPNAILRSNASYRWMNVWATWCKPCVEELPLLKSTFDAWLQKGHAVELTLMSVDADPQAARAFIDARPQLPASLQIAYPDRTGRWLGENGLDTGAAIPVHFILDANSKLVCARAGAVDAQTLERFRQVMFP